MPNGPHIWDSRSDGFLALRHEKFDSDYKLQHRASVICVEVKDRLLPPKYPRGGGQWVLHADPKVGDLNNATFWEKDTREISGWSFAWPSMTTKPSKPKEGNPGSFGGGFLQKATPEVFGIQVNDTGVVDTVALQGQVTNHATQAKKKTPPTSVLPLLGMDPDTRFKPKVPQSIRDTNKKLWPLFPARFIGITIADVEEKKQQDVFHPTDPRLVVAQGFDADMGTIVLGINSDGEIDEDYAAKLQSAFIVVKKPDSNKLPYGSNPFIALNIGQTPLLDSIGGAVFDSGNVGFLNSKYGGPIYATYQWDQHNIDKSDNGVTIASAHLSTDALFIRPSNPTQDGPIYFEVDPYPKDVGSGDKKMPVHLCWDEDDNHQHLTGMKKGRWKLWAESQFTSSSQPPCVRPNPSTTTTPDGPSTAQGPATRPPTYSGPGGAGAIPDSGGQVPGTNEAGANGGFAYPPTMQPWNGNPIGDPWNPSTGGYPASSGDFGPFNSGVPQPSSVDPSVSPYDVFPIQGAPGETGITGGLGENGLIDEGYTYNPWTPPGYSGATGQNPQQANPFPGQSTEDWLRGLGLNPSDVMPGGWTGGPTEAGGPGQTVVHTDGEIQSPSTSTTGEPVTPGGYPPTDAPTGTPSDTNPTPPPVVGRTSGSTAQGTTTTGTSGGNPPPGTRPRYTHQPCAGIAGPGTADGTICNMPPEVTMSDMTLTVLSTDADRPVMSNGMYCSISYYNCAPGTNWSVGVPDLATGGIASGYSWRVRNGGLSFYYHDSTATKKEAVRFTPAQQIAFASGTNYWATLAHANTGDQVYTFPSLSRFVTLNQCSGGLFFEEAIPYGAADGSLTNSDRISFQYANSQLSLGNSGVAGRIRLFTAASAYAIGFTAGVMVANHDYILPTSMPSTNALFMQCDSSGNMSWTNVCDGLFDVNYDRLRIRSTHTPATAGDAGTTGDVCWDSSYIYVCVGPSSWKRAPLSAGW
jgi:hypothetical protein